MTAPLKFFLALIIAASFALFSASIPTHAQAIFKDRTYKVTTPKGLNLRDKDCKVITTMSYGSLVFAHTNEPGSITCTIGGKETVLVKAGFTKLGIELNEGMQLEGYMAKEFTTQLNVRTYPGFEMGYLMNVQPVDGLNLRDENCKKVGTLAHKSEVNLPLYAKINGIICEVNGQKYSMTQINQERGNNTYVNGYVATLYLE
jgi:hypothetical protein